MQQALQPARELTICEAHEEFTRQSGVTILVVVRLLRAKESET
jgi:hypothetical protein